MTSIAVENPGASGKAIEHHYDVKPEFWELWLGSSMTYSCAHWEAGDDLASAQYRKLDLHVAQAGAAGARRVLDVGSGWGSMLKRLTRTHGVQEAIGLTLSPAQKQYVEAQALPGVQVRLESWSDHAPEAPYDAIISIGAFEHFARPGLSFEQKVAGYRSFFQRCQQWLKPGGRLSLQTITYGNMRREHQSAFMTDEIYPESELPTLTEIVEASRGLMEIITLRNDREHYVRTLREWLQALQQNQARILELVGQETYTRYEQYLKYCIVGFHVGNTDLVRVAMRRIDRSRL